MISWRKSIHQRGRKLCRCRRGASLSVFFAGTLQLRQPESQAAFRSSRYNHCRPRGFTLSLALLSVWEGLWEDEDEKRHHEYQPRSRYGACETMVRHQVVRVKASESLYPMRGAEASESPPPASELDRCLGVADRRERRRTGSDRAKPPNLQKLVAQSSKGFA
jgi:hypothetical protein